MNEPFYEFNFIEESLCFTFDSIGKQLISKMVIFQKLDFDDYYQLALVDVLDDGSFSDTLASNNGDRNKILATVYQIITSFLGKHPNAIILFAGSTPSRTRLYQIAINSELEAAQKLFVIMGYNGLSFEVFAKNKNYEAFTISKK